MPTKPQIRRKDQIVSYLIETRRDILAAVSQLSEEQSDQVFLGTWSVNDLLAHTTGWDETNLRALRSVLKGPAEHFNKDFGVRFRGYRVTIQRLLEAEGEDEQTHLRQLVDFFKESK